ncbi:uncharacterized protein B0I36DRAFT_326937, partial [Microdochium trichocladiopsis]
LAMSSISLLIHASSLSEFPCPASALPFFPEDDSLSPLLSSNYIISPELGNYRLFAHHRYRRCTFLLCPLG